MGYSPEDYVGPQRLREFEHQRKLLTGHGPVLEIGPGPGTMAEGLRERGEEVLTVDVDTEHGTDLAASATHLPFADDAFPTVAAFEVLEHLPADDVPGCLAEMARVARDQVVISVPEKEDKLRSHVSTRLLGRTWDANGHEWELGFRFSLRSFLQAADDAGLDLTAWDGRHPWHRFFVFEHGSSSPTRRWLSILARKHAGSRKARWGGPTLPADAPIPETAGDLDA